MYAPKWSERLAATSSVRVGGIETKNIPGSRYSFMIPAQSPSSNDPLKQDLAYGAALRRRPPTVAFSEDHARIGIGASINDMSAYNGRNYDRPDLVAAWTGRNRGQKTSLVFGAGHYHRPIEQL